MATTELWVFPDVDKFAVLVLESDTVTISKECIVVHIIKVRRVGVESGTWHVLSNLRWEWPSVISLANSWASLQPSIALLPSSNLGLAWLSQCSFEKMQLLWEVNLLKFCKINEVKNWRTNWETEIIGGFSPELLVVSHLKITSFSLTALPIVLYEYQIKIEISFSPRMYLGNFITLFPHF